MKSELNEKISCCCTLFLADTYKALPPEEISQRILLAHDFLLGMDIEDEMKEESKSASSFNEYYSVWYKSIHPINVGIGLLIRYKMKNEITNIVNTLNIDNNLKDNMLNILGTIGFILAAKLEIIKETLERLKIAANSSIEINIYRDTTSLNDILSNMRDKRMYSPEAQSQGEEPNYDIGAITEIYNYCKGNTFSVSFKIFIDAVASADFSNIYSKESTITSKCSYLISVIKKFVYSKDWYKNAANSINTEPTRCSGMKVPLDWKEGLQKISRSITPY